jgi:hypothetical protein
MLKLNPNSIITILDNQPLTKIQREAQLEKGLALLTAVKLTIQTALAHGQSGANGSQITKVIKHLFNDYLLVKDNKPKIGYRPLEENQLFFIECLTAFGYKKYDARRMIKTASNIRW